MSDAVVPNSDAPGFRLLERLAQRPLLTLFLFCLALWLPGVLALPPTDRDESRFAQASKQMLESHDFIDIRFGQTPRYKKPIAIYWLQAASAAATGGPTNRIWPYRLPSLLGAFAAVALSFWCLRAFAPPVAALAGAGLLAMTVLLLAEASIATTDAVLLAAVTGAQGVLLRAYLSARDAARPKLPLGLALAGWAAFALGILTKGPVIVGVCGLTVIVLSLWDREWQWFKAMRPLSGLALTVMLTAPWFIAIALASHGQFYQQSLGHDFGAKLATGQETHGGPPGYYLLLATLTLFPATLFVLPSLRSAIDRRRESAIRFLLVWAGAAWAMVELVPTKLPHYVLPAYPALAMLCALWLFEPSPAGARRGQTSLRIIALIQFALGGVALAAAPVVLPILFGGGARWWLVAGAIVAVGAMAFALGAALRRDKFLALAAAAATVLVLYPLTLAGTAPLLQRLWVSPRAVALVREAARPGDPNVIASGYEEASVMFMLGTGTQFLNGADAARLEAQRGGLALIEDHERGAFLSGVARSGASAATEGALTGLNYSRGKSVHVTLYRVAPVRSAPRGAARGTQRR